MMELVLGYCKPLDLELDPVAVYRQLATIQEAEVTPSRVRRHCG